MSFGGYNPAGSSELPFSTPNAGMRSRTSSVSSVHSNQGGGYQQNQQQQQQQSNSSPYQSPYSSRPGTPVGGAGEGYFGNGGGYGAGGYGSGASSPASGSSYILPTPPIPNQQRQQHYGKGGNSNTSGYESPTAVSSSIPTFYSHSRTHSNASETSLNIDTGLMGDDGAGSSGGLYSPGPASSLSSSASSSRRGSFSDSGSGGGFFNRKFGKTFRPEPHQSPEDYPMSRLDGDVMNGDDDDPQGRRKMRTQKNDQKGGRGKVGVKDIFNDWDLLLPSTDPYENDDDYDDQELNEDERRKKRQLNKKGWESPKGQTILLTILVTIAIFVRIWKLAIPSAVV